MKTRLIFFSLIFLQPTSSWAGRPLFTDDAGLTEAHSCQIETWWQESENTHEWWSLPACNPFGNFELTTGVNSLKVDSSNRVKNYLVQGKTLLRPLEIGNYGIGVAFGITRPDEGNGGTNYAYIPVSIMSNTGLTVAHFNLGLLRDRALKDNRITWGLGVEHAWTARISTFGEVFGDNTTNPTFHVGSSFGLIPNLIQLDLTYGHSIESVSSGNFYSIGINVYLPQ